MTKEIIVPNKKIFFNKIKETCKKISNGAEGTTYLKDNKVIKILDGYDDRNHSIEDYLKFSDIETECIYFTKQVYIYNNKVIAVVTKKCPGKNILEINPLNINIDQFMKNYNVLDIETQKLSNLGIQYFDVPFNCMYSNNKMGIIDTAEFFYTDTEYTELLENNLSTVQICYLDFIIEGYFNYFISQNTLLNELYEEIKNNNIEVYKTFLIEFKRNIEEIIDKDLVYLKDASKVIKKTKTFYPRYI